jgi:MFS family permease
VPLASELDPGDHLGQVGSARIEWPVTEQPRGPGRPGERSAGASALAGSVSSTAESSPWAPLRQGMFGWLWLGVLVSSMGTWMQTVGAQWLLLETPHAAALVALVQAANTVPVMLLAFPAGVLADAFDRRWLLFSVQVYFLVVGLLLVGLTLTGRMPPALLLVFTFALGLGAAVQLTAWQASTPELVPREQLRSATRMEMVGVNLARSAGPALAGLVIAHFGVPSVFALNAVSVVPLAIALLLWRRRPAAAGSRERFVPALRAGGRYISHEPVVRRILGRLAMFILPAAALWALLPLVASQRLKVGAGGYGILFAALGVGAIVGALVLGRVRTHLSTNGLLAAAGVLYAAALAVLVLVPLYWVGLVALVFAGLAWTATISNLLAELTLFLPPWVRARAMAIYTMIFTGCQAVGALLWGQVAQHAGLPAAFLAAAVAEGVAVLVGLVWRVGDAGQLSPEPVVYWAEARLAVNPEPDAGPVLVSVEYTIAPDQEPAFLAAMQQLRGSRRRTGAISWELYRDGDRPTRFVEVFRVASWEEHLRQHAGRLTAADQYVEETALAFSDPPARAQHLLPP